MPHLQRWWPDGATLAMPHLQSAGPGSPPVQVNTPEHPRAPSLRCLPGAHLDLEPRATAHGQHPEGVFRRRLPKPDSRREYAAQSSKEPSAGKCQPGPSARKQPPRRSTVPHGPRHSGARSPTTTIHGRTAETGPKLQQSADQVAAPRTTEDGRSGLDNGEDLQPNVKDAEEATDPTSARSEPPT
jgi:hypothetical protein